MAKQRLYTQKAYAAKKGVTERTVRYWIKKKKVKTEIVGSFQDVKGVKMIRED